MTRQEFVDRHKHEVAGLILDAITARNREGGELAMWLRGVMMRVDARIGKMYDELQPVSVPELNGKPAQSPQGAKRT